MRAGHDVPAVGPREDVPRTFHRADRRQPDVGRDRRANGLRRPRRRRRGRRSRATVPRRSRRPCRRGTRRISRRHSSAWTASAASSPRAAAQPWRIAGTVDGVERLPNVPPSSGTRPVSAMISRTRPAGTRSSSAAAWVSSARAPWPHSTLPVITVIVPSCPMWTRAASVRRPGPHPAATAATPSAAGSGALLGLGTVRRHGDQQARAEDLEELPARRVETGSRNRRGQTTRRNRRRGRRPPGRSRAESSWVAMAHFPPFPAARRTASRILG